VFWLHPILDLRVLAFTPSPAQAAMFLAAESMSGSESPALDVEPGRTYAAGTRLKIPATDWSFTVPARWQSSQPPDSDLPLLISEDRRSFGMIFPLHNATRASIRQQLDEPLSLLHGLSFIPAGAVTETDTWIGRSYSGEGMVGQAAAVFGPGGACMMYFIMGPADGAVSYDEVLAELRQTTSFAESQEQSRDEVTPL
jgi:hypothetical protein